jgi:MFS superfamily sulfate permease-like transporter
VPGYIVALVAVPLPVLAAILFVVAWNMGEWREIPEIFKHSKTDIAVWLTTFSLTVLADLTVAVEVGMVLAALLFIHRVARTTTVSRVTPEYIDVGRAHSLQDKAIPEGVVIYRIHGPFLFGATDKLDRITAQLTATKSPNHQIDQSIIRSTDQIIRSRDHHINRSPRQSVVPDLTTVPESTMVPVRETASKVSRLPSMATSMKELSVSKPRAVSSDPRRRLPSRSCPAEPVVNC